MTALEILENLVTEMHKGSDKANRYPRAVTSNSGVAIIFNELIMQTHKAIIEIHKGNVK